MPRRFTSRRRRFRRSHRRRGLMSKIKRAISRIVRPEFKYTDTTLAGDLGSGSPFIQVINQVAQGSDVTNRVGDYINVRSIGLRFFIQHPTGTYVPASQVIRLMLVCDTENQNSAPVITDILTGSNPGSWKNISTVNPKRFKILWDKYVYLRQPSTGVVAGSTSINGFTVKKYIRLKRGIPVHFVNTGSSAWQNRSLFVVAVSNQTTANGSAGINGFARIRFTDA